MKRLGNRLDGAIHDFEKARRSRQQQEAETLERLARRAGMHPQAAAMLALNLAPPPKTTLEPFVMLHPLQNAAVSRWLRENSKRPIAAMALWIELFTAVHPTTGEVLLSRADLAERVGILPRDVSSIMTELVSINAITRCKEGRRVRYVMNPHVATHIASPEARHEAREKSGPLLTLVQGGAV